MPSQHCQNPCEVFLLFSVLFDRIGLAQSQTEFQTKERFTQISLFLAQVFKGHVANFFKLHNAASISWREINLVLIDSFAAASRIASLAMSCDTPSIS